MRVGPVFFMASLPAFTRGIPRIISRPPPAMCVPHSRCRTLRRTLMNEAIKEDADLSSIELKSTFLETMRWRGFLKETTDIQTLDKELSTGRVVAYLGFDATASSLHVGSLLQIMLLRHFQKCGHKPIVLIGGGTTKVGDPSGKDASRQLLTQEAIQKNIDGITSVFSKCLCQTQRPPHHHRCRACTRPIGLWRTSYAHPLPLYLFWSPRVCTRVPGSSNLGTAIRTPHW